VNPTSDQIVQQNHHFNSDSTSDQIVQQNHQDSDEDNDQQVPNEIAQLSGNSDGPYSEPTNLLLSSHSSHDSHNSYKYYARNDAGRGVILSQYFIIDDDATDDDLDTAKSNISIELCLENPNKIENEDTIQLHISKAKDVPYFRTLIENCRNIPTGFDEENKTLTITNEEGVLCYGAWADILDLLLSEKYEELADFIDGMEYSNIWRVLEQFRHIGLSMKYFSKLFEINPGIEFIYAMFSTGAGLSEICLPGKFVDDLLGLMEQMYVFRMKGKLYEDTLISCWLLATENYYGGYAGLNEFVIQKYYNEEGPFVNYRRRII